MKLFDILNIKNGIISVIGAGGKTSLINMLAKELKSYGTVIITTTTHIYPFSDYKVFTDYDEETVKAELSNKKCVCIGKACDNGKLTAPDVSIDTLSQLAEFVLVEADGAKHMSFKAHDAFEPVIPKSSCKTILVIGVDSIGEKIEKVVHRANIFCKICNCTKDDLLTAELAARFVNYERLCDIVFINKVENKKDVDNAIKLAKLIESKCFYGSLKKGTFYACSN